MSYPTERDGSHTEGGERGRFSARRTVRDEMVHRRPAISTVRDAYAYFTPRATDWIATPTQRDLDAQIGPGWEAEPPVELLSRYAVHGFLARGAEAELWRVVRLADNLECVLKVYFSGIRPDPSVLASIANKPAEHFPVLYEHGEIEGRYFEAMEYQAHGSLRDQLRFGPVDPVSGRHLVRELATGLDSLHARDVYGSVVVHCDFKPDNILLRTVDPLDYVLSDFGVSLLADQGIAAPPRRRGHTPHYSAPEWLAEQPGTKSDFWSLGITLLEALSGIHPFAGLSAEEVQHRIADHWKPNFPDSMAPSWRELIAGLLNHDSQMRWGGAEVRRWLRRESGEEFTGMSGEETPPGDQRSFASALELAVYLAGNWSEVAPLILDEVAGRWLDDQVAALAPHIDLRHLRAEAAASEDQRLLRLIYRLAPGLPPVWKSWSVSPADVAPLCGRAFADDPEMQVLTKEIHTQNVLGEIGRLTQRTDLTKLATDWNRAWLSFVESRDRLARMSGPVDRLQSGDVMLASLFLAVSHGLQEGQRETHLSLRLCCPWAVPLLERQADDIVAALLVSLLLPRCEQANADHLTENFEFNPGTTITGTPVFQWGWNPPVIAFSATHTPVSYMFCDQAIPIGNQLRLSWNVSGAGWVYLLGISRVSLVGEMERREGASVQYGLLAVNATGITLSRLPVIAHQTIRLHDQPILCEEVEPVPALSSDDFNSQIKLAECHTARDLWAQDGAGSYLKRDDLPIQTKLSGAIEYRDRELGAEDLPIQRQWNRLKKGKQ